MKLVQIKSVNDLVPLGETKVGSTIGMNMLTVLERPWANVEVLVGVREEAPPNKINHFLWIKND